MGGGLPLQHEVALGKALEHPGEAAVHGQVVNDFRIAEAMRLLAETDRPVTTIQFEAGFLTKSNFNREFRRVTGTSPSAYRKGLNAAEGRPPGSA